MLLVVFGDLELLDLILYEPVVVHFAQYSVDVLERDEVLVEQQVEAAQVALLEHRFARDAVPHCLHQRGFRLAFDLVRVLVLARLHRIFEFLEQCLLI